MSKSSAVSGVLGFLGRLRRDTRGNALAIMAAMTIPLAGLAGSAVDMSRLYTVKSRLQQACDAGVLAGRKMLVDSSSTTLDTAAAASANTFFTSNFKSGWFSTTNVSFTPAKTADKQVSGTASATVPMAMMTIFGIASKTLTVTCEARYDVADADIMFVLDTTGSMSCATADSQSTCDSYASSASNVVLNADGSYSVTEKTNSRIAGLRSAVASFYTTLTGAADASTHFRFGFVPYSATVNVGYLLSRSQLATTNWTYQTRIPVLPYTNNGSATNSTQTLSSAACTALQGTGAFTVTPSSTTAAYTATTTTTTFAGSASSGTCSIKRQPVKAVFRYTANSTNITNYASGMAVANPAMLDGSTNTWAGCIEERDTLASSSFNASSPPLDLDVDTAPTSEATRWRPMWPEIIFARNTTGLTEDYSGYRTRLTRYQYGTSLGSYEIANLLNEVVCPKRAQRLTTMTASDFTNYLSASNGFRPYGVTYHDVGMTWGTRLLSPQGIFASDTAAWSGHNPPNRYIIFLTDGALDTDEYAYTSHGIEQWDKRVANGTTSNLTTYHNTRFATACQIAKNHNIVIFVIAYAQTMTTTLQDCASSGQAYYASDTTALNAAFTKIASQVAMLRITK